MEQKEWVLFFVPILLQTLFPSNTSSIKVEGIKKVRNREDNPLYQKVSAQLSIFLPTAENPSDRLDKKCVEDSQLVVKALMYQEEWAFSSKL